MGGDAKISVEDNRSSLSAILCLYSRSSNRFSWEPSLIHCWCYLVLWSWRIMKIHVEHIKFPHNSFQLTGSHVHCGVSILKWKRTRDQTMVLSLVFTCNGIRVGKTENGVGIASEAESEGSEGFLLLGFRLHLWRAVFICNQPHMNCFRLQSRRKWKPGITGNWYNICYASLLITSAENPRIDSNDPLDSPTSSICSAEPAIFIIPPMIAMKIYNKTAAWQIRV